MAKPYRGLDSKHEHAAQNLARDTRPLGTRVAEKLSHPNAILMTVSMGAVIIFLFPIIFELVFIACYGLYWFASTRKVHLPFRLPESSGALDHNDPKPGSSLPNKARGISFFGNDRVTNEEIWFTNDDMRTHVLIFGSTGSGKTVALTSIAYNSLIHGSGFIYVDGKGDNSLFANIFSMVRGMGREDDMLLINFMTGARDVLGPQENRLSNTMNPFSSGSSSMLSQLIISLMDSGSGGSSGDMWKGRAMSFVESLMKILAAMRDAGHILLDANSIREYFMLEKLEQIVVDLSFPVSDTHNVPLSDFPKEIIEPLKNYVLNLPGYNMQKKGNQASEVREQHGFITMQLTRVFGSLADTYGHIIRTNLAEVDLKDVVLNRRILVVLLPALEKSPEELSNLGKVIIASLKCMMAAGLGDSVEGEYRDVIERKPTNAASPYVCIMDEYGYYAVPGFAVVPAQARSLGFSAIFAGQDLPAFQKASKEEAASIGANCNIKLCMKLEDPQETWDFFNKVAGETYVTNVSGFQVNAGSMTQNYLDTRNASVDRRQRIELLDLKDQREGEAHIFFKSKIVRAKMFYANPKPVPKMRINHHIKVESPLPEELINLDKRLSKTKELFENEDYKMPRPKPSEDISLIARSLSESDELKPFERGVAALIAILENEVQKQREMSAPYEEKAPTDSISCFTRITVSPLVLKMIGPPNADLFSLPLIRAGSLVKEIKHIERIIGNSEDESKKTASKLIKDLEVATSFPTNIKIKQDPEQYLQDIIDVIDMLGGDTSGLDVEVGDLPPPEEFQGQNDLLEAQSEFEKIASSLPDFSSLEKLPTLEEVEEFLKNAPDFGKLPSLPDLPDLEGIDAADVEGELKPEDLEELPSLAELEALLKEELERHKKVREAGQTPYFEEFEDFNEEENTAVDAEFTDEVEDNQNENEEEFEDEDEEFDDEDEEFDDEDEEFDDEDDEIR